MQHTGIPIQDDTFPMASFPRIPPTIITQEERARNAQRRGFCPTCPTKTHRVRLLSPRIPLTNDDVYQGICIKCNNHSVPPSILQEWQAQLGVVRRVKRINAAVRVTPRPLVPPQGPYNNSDNVPRAAE